MQIETSLSEKKLPRGIISRVAKKAKVSPSAVYQAYKNGNLKYIKLINIEIEKHIEDKAELNKKHKELLNRVQNGN